MQRIEKYAQPKVQIVNSSPLPVNCLISLVDAHYKSYQNLQIIRVSKFTKQLIETKIKNIYFVSF